MEIKKIVVGPLQTNCYLLADGRDLAVIDPGDDAVRISEAIEMAGAAPKFIINTHSHSDHTGANIWLKKKYGMPVAAGINELPQPGFYPEIFLRAGQDIKIGETLLKVMETPGHTAGGICLFGPDFVISGDTLFEDSIGRTDLPGGSDADMVRSLQKLDKIIATGATVYPGHGNIFKYRKGMAAGWVGSLE
jgi:hydroxyacylglutathione hydrolase